MVYVCRGTARRPRYNNSITTRWKFCSRFINTGLNAQYLPSYHLDRKLYMSFRLVPKSSAEGPRDATGISKRQRITLRLLYAMSRPSVVCLSVCLSSVTLVHPTQAVELFGNFFSPYDSPGTPLFWCQNSLVGDAPFPPKFAFKVTHPLSNSEISTNIGS